MVYTAPSKTRVLITGASGWLGQFVWQRFVQDYREPVPDEWFFDNSNVEVYGTYSTHKPDWIPEDRAVKLDLEDEKSIVTVLSGLMPDVIVHLAAISFPNICEKDPVRGDRVNNPSSLIAAIKMIVPQCTVIFTSSALVYDGEHAPYKPDFDTNAVPPTCAYGVSKLKFEQQILTLPRSTVLRLSNLLGPSCVYRHGEFKFMEWLFTAFKKRDYLDFRHDEIRSFMFVNDVVDIIANIVAAAEQSHFQARGDASSTNKRSKGTNLDLSQVYGQVFNVGGPRGLSRLDIAAMVAEACNVEAKIGTLLLVSY